MLNRDKQVLSEYLLEKCKEKITRNTSFRPKAAGVMNLTPIEILANEKKCKGKNL